ncbi:MAG: cytochrome P450 [Betaproteobacteria bacterium]|nr:cytochrome P450 [Betaproteobacteria bacterium]
MLLDYQPDDPGFLADPFPFYRRMQDEDPCHWSPRIKAWVLTRYDDVKRVCLDREMSSDRLRPFFASMPGAEAAKIGGIMRYLSLWMVFRDAPEHTRLRRLTGKVFNLKSMRDMRPNIESLTAWLLDAIGEREEIDFISAFAGPLPALVIMDMLGVPRTELSRVKRMSDDVALFIGSSRASPEKYAIAEAATREMAEFFRAMITARRAQPAADLLSELVHLEDAGDRLSDDELVATCILLLFAGHETTTNHIANSTLSLIRFPEAMQQLRVDPGLAARAAEELLRYDGPSAAQVRIVKEQHQLHGKTLKAGDRVFILLNAANRDPRAYPDADRVILERDGVPHLTFGFGLHICLGFPLARLEGEISLPAVLQRFRRIELAGAPEWINSMVFRGMSRMPVRVAR